jgi:uncharacterized protein with ParB-like and HNH nuclease domain
MKYEVKVFKFKDIDKNLIKPDFQRNFVWKEDKKLSLISTIKLGYPIGTILLSPKGNTEKFLLIDGLQRISTLKEIKKNPFQYLSIDELTDDLIVSKLIDTEKEIRIEFNKFKEEHQLKFLETIKSTIIEEIKNGRKENLKDTKIANIISKNLIRSIPFFKNQDLNISEGITDIIFYLRNLLDVDEVELPAIIFKGTDSELSYVFQMLNSGGVKLSKYDIFAATWQDSEILVNKESGLIDIVIEKYNNSEVNEGIEVDGFDENQIRETGILNLFEYSFALSKAISNASDFLFVSKSLSEVDSFGFNLLAAIFDLNNKNMKQLDAKIREFKIDYSQLKSYILICLKEIENALGKWVKALDQNKYYFEFKEFQVVAFITTLFKLRYKLTTNSIINIQSENNKHINNFLNNIHLNYLYDTLKNEWGNAGDSKLDELVLKDIKNSRLLHKPNKESFELIFYEWVNESNNSQIIPIKNTTKMVLNYLIKFNINTNNIKNNTKLNFEHIIPQKRLKKFVDLYPEYPISSISNLTIIPEYGNKSKKELTYYEWIEGKSDPILLDEEKLKLYLYPAKEELSFIKSKETFTYQNYIGFLKDRKNTLLNQIRKIFS